MSQELPVDRFEWFEVEDIWIINEKLKWFIKLLKNYDEESDKGYILEANIEYLKNLHDIHSDLSFLPERMKINKCNKRVCNLYDIRTLKQALDHGQVLQNVHRIIKFNQKLWLKPYIDMNTKLKSKSKKWFWERFF